MKIAIGSDHRGYTAKEHLKVALIQKEHEVEDFGTDSAASCDYPDFAYRVSDSVRSGRNQVGILLCGTGIGSSMAANKVVGIRAALCHDELTAELARRHNDANVLCLAADLTGESLLQRIAEVWLATPFDGGRHERRVHQIAQIEASECDRRGK
jgi:ribose 5-phosphate isomerase B